MTRRFRTTHLPASLTFLALAGVALLVSHDAIFLVQLGPGEGLVRVLRTAGHDYWGAATALLVATGLLVATATIVRLRSLRRHATALGTRAGRASGYGRRALRAWAVLLVVVAAGFFVQENVEHLLAHGHAIGLGALLSAEYPLALPVITVITGIAALVAALVSGAEQSLLAAIASAMKARHRPSRVQSPPAMSRPRRPSVLSRPGASRAPPVMFAA